MQSIFFTLDNFSFILFSRRLSSYDQTKREFFVDISSYLDTINLTEKQEYDIFNKLFRHCQFINELSKQTVYSTKYQMCLGYTSLNQEIPT